MYSVTDSKPLCKRYKVLFGQLSYRDYVTIVAAIVKVIKWFIWFLEELDDEDRGVAKFFVMIVDGWTRQSEILVLVRILTVLRLCGASLTATITVLYIYADLNRPSGNVDAINEK